MNTLQIERFMYNDEQIAKYYIGTFPIDSLPVKIWQKRAYFVINTASASLPGSTGHWLSVCLEPHDINEIYDSFALPVYDRRIKMLLGKHYRALKYRLQELDSSVCGQYACYFLYKKARNYSMEEIVDIFDKENSNLNDKKMELFFEQKAGFKLQ